MDNGADIVIDGSTIRILTREIQPPDRIFFGIATTASLPAFAGNVVWMEVPGDADEPIIVEPK